MNVGSYTSLTSVAFTNYLTQKRGKFQHMMCMSIDTSKWMHWQSFKNEGKKAAGNKLVIVFTSWENLI